MRKGFVLQSLICLLAVSCSVHEIETIDPVTAGDDVFFASLESYSTPDTRVYVDNDNTVDGKFMIFWDEEDKISIFNETTLELYITNVTEAAAQEWALGDVNHDTFVNVADVTALIKYVLTSGDEPEEFYAEQANVDGDAAGVLNVADVTALIQLVLNQ